MHDVGTVLAHHPAQLSRGQRVGERRMEAPVAALVQGRERLRQAADAVDGGAVLVLLEVGGALDPLGRHGDVVAALDEPAGKAADVPFEPADDRRVEVGQEQHAKPGHWVHAFGSGRLLCRYSVSVPMRFAEPFSNSATARRCRQPPFGTWPLTMPVQVAPGSSVT